jgi:putative cell wall-binding protein
MKKWSQKVTETSNSLDLEKGVFTFNDPKKIAQSLKKSAEQSSRRKGSPYQSAMSMLNFYINRAGKNLAQEREEILETAKLELKKLFSNNSNPANS